MVECYIKIIFRTLIPQLFRTFCYIIFTHLENSLNIFTILQLLRYVWWLIYTMSCFRFFFVTKTKCENTKIRKYEDTTTTTKRRKDDKIRQKGQTLSAKTQRYDKVELLSFLLVFSFSYFRGLTAKIRYEINHTP
jgi:hypothetical protein